VNRNGSMYSKLRYKYFKNMFFVILHTYIHLLQILICYFRYRFISKKFTTILSLNMKLLEVSILVGDLVAFLLIIKNCKKGISLILRNCAVLAHYLNSHDYCTYWSEYRINFLISLEDSLLSP
jgi:hypothetical protein